MNDKALQITNLSVAFERPEGEQVAIYNVGLEVHDGEAVAIVGESGCGKTVLCKTVLQLLCPRGRVRSGAIKMKGINLLTYSDSKMEAVRGKAIAMVFQDPAVSLDPVMSIGKQIVESILLHKEVSVGSAKAANAESAKAEAIKLLEQVGIEDAQAAYKMMPHEFSGGMKQRAAIAIALAGEPQILLADEPTTALDATTQQQILDLLKSIQKARNLSIVLVTHDLMIARGFADRIAVMKDGLIVECGTPEEIFAEPKHEYTAKLLSYLDYGNHRWRDFGNEIRLAREEAKDRTEAVNISKLTKTFSLSKKHTVTAFRDLDMCIYAGELLGISGKSGSGKTTLAKCIMGLETPTAGTIVFSGMPRAECALIFQDSPSAFNPRMKIKKIIGEPLRIASKKGASDEQIFALMELVELSRNLADRYPYEISGGQRQRVAIARALAMQPKFIIADEPIASLDISLQFQILRLFKQLQQERELTIMLISHDLPMLKHVADRIINMSE